MSRLRDRVVSGTVRTLAALGVTVALLAPLPSLDAQAQRPRVKFPAYQFDIALDTLVFTRDTVSAPAAQTFAAVRAAYAALRIPREWADSANGQLGTLRLRASTSLAGQRLSRYFNCGQGLTGDHADMWRLSIAMVTFVQPADGGVVRVGTGLAAQAQDMAGASKDPVGCGSTGLLEARVMQLVREALAKAS